MYNTGMITNGRSWRITAPLRKTITLGRSLRQKLSHLSPVRTLPKRVILKLVRWLALRIFAYPRIHRMMLAVLNRFPGIKKRLKNQIYRDLQEIAHISVYEQPLPMSPPVRKIHMDLLVAIQKQEQNTPGE